jgi:hypothetical protein
MCHPVRCASCGKTTWSGCGLHVDDVMANVAPDQRCTCNPTSNPPTEQSARRFPWFRSSS